MGKKSMEIGLSIGSVLVLTIMLIMVNMLIPAYSGYGFVASLAVFVLIVSAIGVKLAIYE
ncbi:MAG: hypothetical protein U9N13_09200 [Euryarchaeota archaeon]|nr:hypothetical protein [Euryarchaeota archaeon]